MRRAALTALALNVLLLIWFTVRPAEKSEGDAVSSVYDDIVALRVVRADLSDTPSQSASANNRCLEIGPLPENWLSDQFTGFPGGEFNAYVLDRVIGQDSLLRVYVPSQASRTQALALLGQVRQSGYAGDAYVVVGGELENAISFGLFASDANAERAREQLLELGWQVDVAEELRDRTRRWLQIPAEALTPEDRSLVADWVAANAELSISENLCETIAQPILFP